HTPSRTSSSRSSALRFHPLSSWSSWRWSAITISSRSRRTRSASRRSHSRHGSDAQRAIPARTETSTSSCRREREPFDERRDRLAGFREPRRKLRRRQDAFREPGEPDGEPLHLEHLRARVFGVVALRHALVALVGVRLEALLREPRDEFLELL